jgi:hypothetical protein
MRMYELWKLGKPGKQASRLEDAGGPVLFSCVYEAEEFSRGEPDRWEASFAIVQVRVGTAEQKSSGNSSGNDSIGGSESRGQAFFENPRWAVKGEPR